MSIIESLVNIIAPHHCLVCQEEGYLLCANCAAGLVRLPERCYRCRRLSDGFRTCPACSQGAPLYAVYGSVAYEGAAKEIVRRFKFERARAAAQPIARIMACGSFSSGLIVSHIPTADARVRMRGYDQAALIAKEFARYIQRPYFPLLARVGDERQLGKRREARREQMSHAFRPINTQLLPAKQILLIDDVLTTGSTCEAAARVLCQAGAARVSACVFAVA